MSQFTWPERPDEARNHASPYSAADTSDLADEANERATLTANEQAVERTLLADGASWRRSVSPGLPGVSDFVARAERRLASERASAKPPAMQNARPAVAQAPQQAAPIPLNRPSTNIGQLQKGPYPVTASRWRWLAGAVVALIVVGMVGLLLAHNLGGRGQIGGLGNATSTPTQPPTPFATPHGPGSGNTGNTPIPVFAASNPQIVYLAQNSVIRRSTDGGKTYTTVTTPSTTLKNVTFVVAVSPLDANHLIATGTGDRNADHTCPAAPGQAAGADRQVQTRELADTLSGYAPCSQSFFSGDGGQTWSYLALPNNDVIGSVSSYYTIPSGIYSPSSTILAQGSRLYAAIGQTSDYGLLNGAPATQLVVSDDGGATWRVASNGLPASVCDFAPAPTGNTVYAVVAATSCNNEVPSALTLWRSDDAGVSWAQISDLPTPNEAGMIVSPSGALYIYMPRTLSAAQSHQGPTVDESASAVIVSVDGGVTFTRAPTSGAPAGAMFSGPLGVLSDGSILSMTYDGQSNHTTLYAWQSGASAWRKVGAVVPGTISELVVAPHGGGETLYVVDSAGQILHFNV